MDQLPRNLDVMKVMTKTDDKTLGFLGELCPLSNFFLSQFTFNGINYHSSEQLIQHIKSQFCGERQMERTILAAKTPLECNILSRDISNFNFKSWADHAWKLCMNGLEAKFTQTLRAMQALLETGSKKLAECAKDSLWGTGVPLHQPNCLNERYWKGQGILGEILQEIRHKHIQIAKSLLPAINSWHTQGPPPLLKPHIDSSANSNCSSTSSHACISSTYASTIINTACNNTTS